MRKAHGNLSAAELMALSIIQLNNYGIEEIDNLEVFEQIRELHLSGNNIKVVENLEFLRNLEYLDLSNNCIDSEGLRKALGRFPDSLQTLVLGGNQCCHDEELLSQLNDIMPNLGIVIGMEQRDDNNIGYDAHAEEAESLEEEMEAEEEDNDDFEELKLNGREVGDYGTQAEDGRGVLDADAVLRSIVERKCVLQNLQPKFNIECTIDSLNAECTKALEQVNARLVSAKINRQNAWEALQGKRIAASQSERTEAPKSGPADEWLERSKKRSAESKAFLATLRESALKNRDSTFSQVVSNAPVSLK